MEESQKYINRALKSQFYEWHPIFGKLGFKSTIIPVEKRFIDYLLRDGVCLPEDEDDYSD